MNYICLILNSCHEPSVSVCLAYNFEYKVLVQFSQAVLFKIKKRQVIQNKYNYMALVLRYIVEYLLIKIFKFIINYY